MSLADNPTHIAGATALGGEILPPGINFGQYKILGLLGRGGMGEVYRVRHNVLATDFAIKLINSDIAAQPGIRQRFMNEAKTMANLKHPGIVQVDDFGEKTLGFELPSEINPSLSPAWDVWLRRALSSNPDRRFPSASEMIRAMPYATTTRAAPKVRTPSPPHPPTVEDPSSHEEAWWLDENHKEAPSQTANIHSAGTAAQLGTKWLKFWSYFILPAFGVMHFSLGLSSPDAAIILILLGMLKFAVAFGLHRRRLWAWKWNRLMIFIYCAIWLVISVAGIIETAPSNQDNGTLIISISSAILAILLILWANQTYWKKRKSLFSW